MEEWNSDPDILPWMPDVVFFHKPHYRNEMYCHSLYERTHSENLLNAYKEGFHTLLPCFFLILHFDKVKSCEQEVLNEDRSKADRQTVQQPYQKDCFLPVSV